MIVMIEVPSCSIMLGITHISYSVDIFMHPLLFTGHFLPIQQSVLLHVGIKVILVTVPECCLLQMIEITNEKLPKKV
jgi:hypothetical protein